METKGSMGARVDHGCCRRIKMVPQGSPLAAAPASGFIAEAAHLALPLGRFAYVSFLPIQVRNAKCETVHGARSHFGGQTSKPQGIPLSFQLPLTQERRWKKHRSATGAVASPTVS